MREGIHINIPDGTLSVIDYYVYEETGFTWEKLLEIKPWKDWYEDVEVAGSKRTVYIAHNHSVGIPCNKDCFIVVPHIKLSYKARNQSETVPFEEVW